MMRGAGVEKITSRIVKEGTNMFQDLLKPHVQLGTFLLRLGLAAIFIFHGYLKFAQGNGAHWHDRLTEASQLAVTWGELTCGASLLFGLLSRIAVIGIIIMQVGAIAIQTGQWDFINTDYIAANPGRIPTGAEYNFALITMCLAILVMGSGKVSLDYLIFGSRESNPSSGPRS
jgi:putative oxidoreductase